MADQISGTNEAQSGTGEVDPWAAAFAALEFKGKENSEADTDSGSNDAGDDSDADTPNGQDGSQADGEHGSEHEDAVGGLGDNAGEDIDESGSGSGNAFTNAEGVTEDSIKEFEENLNEDIRNQAMNDVAQEFIKRGIRNKNGVLGATMDDADICKRDEDGVPHFYNPETGQEFRGDNPRRQAQEWVDDYNRELARVFNNTCEQYEQHLRQESNPKLEVMKFKPKYDKLDDIRRGMFENVIEDYEIKDGNGDVIGYSCDLDKALALVDRQINMIQGYAKQHQQKQKEEPSGPALDMKTSSGAVQAGNDTPPASLAEAMERLQNAQLDKLKNK